MMNNEILLRRKNMLELNVPENVLDLSIEDNVKEQEKRDSSIASILKNISSYGYMLDNSMINKLKNSNYSDIVNWYLSIKDVLIDVIGLREHMEPVYKNFPQDVMATDESEMYLASLVYFLSNNTISPKEMEERPELNEFRNLILISEADESTYNAIFTNLLSSKISFGVVDKADVTYFVLNNERFFDLLPSSIPNKENLITLTQLCIDNFGYEDSRTTSLTSIYKTATDILRLAVALSDGDVSLSSKCKFKKFNRSERRFLLNLLNNVKYPLEDMCKYKKQWIALGEIIHPGEYKNKYKNAFDSFTKIRNNAKFPKFNGKVNAAFEKKDLKGLLSLLSKRPGEFGRSLDRCLSTFTSKEDVDQILTSFDKIADTMESTILIGLMQHMKDRKNKTDSRIFFPKGKISKAFFIENNMKKIDEDVLDRTISICQKALISIYSKKEPMGKVYVDETLKDYMFPMTLRNASRTLKPMARGSKMKLKDNCNVARMFVYWKEPENLHNVDLDLSVILLNKDFKLEGTCYYGNYSNANVKAFGCYHSGDVRKAPQGAAEYIDLDLAKLKAKNVAYVLTCVHSFTQEPFYDLAEAFVGVMEREKPNDGEIFEPSTVANKSDLITEQITSLAMMLNVEDNSITWLDLGTDANHVDGVCNNINNSKGNIIPMTKAFMKRNFISIYDLISLNVEARGEFVDNKADADYIFSLEGYVEPEIEEDTQVVEAEIQETTNEDIEDTKEEIVEEPPKRILITPFNIDVLIGNYL